MWHIFVGAIIFYQQTRLACHESPMKSNTIMRALQEHFSAKHLAIIKVNRLKLFIFANLQRDNLSENEKCAYFLPKNLP